MRIAEWAAGIMRDRRRRQPPAMPAAPVGRRDCDEIDDIPAPAAKAAENKAPRQAGLAENPGAGRPGRRSRCAPRLPLLLRDRLLDRAYPHGSDRGRRHCAQSPDMRPGPGLRRIDSHCRNGRQRQIAREGDQALDGLANRRLPTRRRRRYPMRRRGRNKGRCPPSPRPEPAPATLLPTSGLVRAPRPLRIVRR